VKPTEIYRELLQGGEKIADLSILTGSTNLFFFLFPCYEIRVGNFEWLAKEVLSNLLQFSCG
jgi:hypothetical protein